MKRVQLLRFLFLAFLTIPAAVHAQAWSGIIAPSRASASWQNAGVQGGIPSGSWANCVTSQCNMVEGGMVTAASVQAAINSASANTVVNIPAAFRLPAVKDRLPIPTLNKMFAISPRDTRKDQRRSHYQIAVRLRLRLARSAICKLETSFGSIN